MRIRIALRDVTGVVHVTEEVFADDAPEAREGISALPRALAMGAGADLNAPLADASIYVEDADGAKMMVQIGYPVFSPEDLVEVQNGVIRKAESVQPTEPDTD